MDLSDDLRHIGVQRGEIELSVGQALLLGPFVLFSLAPFRLLYFFLFGGTRQSTLDSTSGRMVSSALMNSSALSMKSCSVVGILCANSTISGP